MGGKNSQPSGNTTTTTTAEPPAWQTPYMQDYLGRAADWVRNRSGYYTDGYGTVPQYGQMNLGDGYFSMAMRDAAGSSGFRPSSGVAGFGGNDWLSLNGDKMSAFSPFSGVEPENMVGGLPGPSGDFVPGNAQYTPNFDTVAGFNPTQQAGMDSALGYVSGSQLPGQTADAVSMGLNPYANPYLQQAGSMLPGQYNYLSGAMNNPLSAPGINFNPGAGFGEFGAPDPNQTINAMMGTNPNSAINTMMGANPVPGVNQMMGYDPSGAINQMMSATPDMNIYSPLYEQIASKTSDVWNQQIAPTIRNEAQAAGAYGDPKYSQSLGTAAGELDQNMRQSMERLTAQAAQDALQQRQYGTGMAANLLSGGTGMAANILGQGAGMAAGQQQYGTGLAQNQGMNRMGLGANLASQAANMDLSAQQGNLSGGLGAAGLIGSQFGNLYGTGMDTMARSMALAPQAYGMGMMPAQTMMDIGGMQQNMQQQFMNDAYSRWNAEQMGPLQDLLTYQGMVSPQFGQTSSSVQPYYEPSTMQNMFSGGLAGYGAASALGAANPWMWGLGGAAALGLFG